MTESYLIVGLGSIGARHLANLRTLRPEANILIWNHEASIDRLLPKGANSFVYSFDEVRQQKVAAAIISNPASLHLNFATSLAEIGVHLLIEKPLSSSADGVPQLLNYCGENNLICMTAYNLRYMPSLQKLKEQITKEVVGKPIYARLEIGQYLPSWRPGKDYRATVSAQQRLGGGALNELSHELDYLIWLFGMPLSVYAVGGKFSTLEIDVEDMVELVFRFNEPQFIASVNMNFIQKHASRSCKVIGDAGELEWSAIDDTLILFEGDNGDMKLLQQASGIDRNSMYISELEDFLNCIKTGEQPLVSGADGHNVLCVVEAARLSLQTDRPVLIKPAQNEASAQQYFEKDIAVRAQGGQS